MYFRLCQNFQLYIHQFSVTDHRLLALVFLCCDTALGPVTIVGLDAVGDYISNFYPKIPKLNATDSCTIRS